MKSNFLKFSIYNKNAVNKYKKIKNNYFRTGLGLSIGGDFKIYHDYSLINVVDVLLQNLFNSYGLKATDTDAIITNLSQDKEPLFIFFKITTGIQYNF